MGQGARLAGSATPLLKWSHLVLHFLMPEQISFPARVFKSAWFSKSARKAGIADAELCKAVRQAMQGQADDLGGGVFKKRLNDNMHRSIILAEGGQLWVYQYLFAKKDRANIEDDELTAFRALAKSYAGLTEVQINKLVQNQEFVEICHEHKIPV